MVLVPWRWKLGGPEQSVTVDLVTGRAVFSNSTDVDSLIGIENVGLYYGNDSILGNGLGNALEGSRGNDTIAGASGDDTIHGGGGNDSLDGGSGNNDWIIYGSTELIGSSTYTSATINLAAGRATVTELYSPNGGLTGNDSFVGFENIFGSDGNDLLIGDDNGNVIFGGTGADTMIGDQGNDWFLVQDLSDTVVEVTGAGSDTIMAMVSITVPNNIEVTIVDPSLNSGLRINGSSNHELLIGNQFSDTLYGNAGNDTIQGGLGSNFLSGGEGDDVILTGNTSIAQVYALFT